MISFLVLRWTRIDIVSPFSDSFMMHDEIEHTAKPRNTIQFENVAIFLVDIVFNCCRATLICYQQLSSIPYLWSICHRAQGWTEFENLFLGRTGCERNNIPSIDLQLCGQRDETLQHIHQPTLQKFSAFLRFPSTLRWKVKLSLCNCLHPMIHQAANNFLTNITNLWQSFSFFHCRLAHHDTSTISISQKRSNATNQLELASSPKTTLESIRSFRHVEQVSQMLLLSKI